MKLWKKNGKLIVNENKQPILCDDCPCDNWWTIEWGGESYHPGYGGLSNSWSGPTRREWHGFYKYNRSNLFNYLKQLENRMFTTMYFDKSVPDCYVWGHKFQDYIFDTQKNKYRNTRDYYGFSQGTGKYDLSDRQTCESYFTTLSTAPSSVQNADFLTVNWNTRPQILILRLDEVDQWRIFWPYNFDVSEYPGGQNLAGYYSDFMGVEHLYYNPYNENIGIYLNTGGTVWNRVSPDAPLSSVFKFNYFTYGSISDSQDERIWNNYLSDYSDYPIGATLEIMGVGKQYDTGKYARMEILSTSTDNGFPMYDQNNNLIMPKGRCDIYIKIYPGQIKKTFTYDGCIVAKTYNEEGYVHTWFEIK